MSPTKMPTTTAAERQAQADALDRCRWCRRKFSPQGILGHERYCVAKPNGR
jgi:hypothetical protein